MSAKELRNQTEQLEAALALAKGEVQDAYSSRGSAVDATRKLSQELSSQAANRLESVRTEQSRYQELQLGFSELQTAMYHEKDSHIDTTKKLSRTQIQVKQLEAEVSHLELDLQKVRGHHSTCGGLSDLLS